MDEQKLHQLTIVARERMEVDGVTNVGSFNREEISLETGEGGLVIRGAIFTCANYMWKKENL